MTELLQLISWGVVLVGGVLTVVGILRPIQFRRALLGVTVSVLGFVLLEISEVEPIIWPKHSVFAVECSLKDAQALKDGLREFIEADKPTSANLIWIGRDGTDPCPGVPLYNEQASPITSVSTPSLISSGQSAPENCHVPSNPIQTAFCASEKVIEGLLPPAAWRAQQIVLVSNRGGEWDRSVSKADLYEQNLNAAFDANVPIRSLQIGDQPATVSHLSAQLGTLPRTDTLLYQLRFQIGSHRGEELNYFKYRLTLEGWIYDRRTGKAECGNKVKISSDFDSVGRRVNRVDGNYVVTARVADTLNGTLKTNPRIDFDAKNILFCSGWTRVTMEVEAMTVGDRPRKKSFRDVIYLQQWDTQKIAVIESDDLKNGISTPNWLSVFEDVRLIGQFEKVHLDRRNKNLKKLPHLPTDDQCWNNVSSFTSDIARGEACLSKASGVVLVELDKNEIRAVENSFKLTGKIQGDGLSALVIGPPNEEVPELPWLFARSSETRVKGDAEVIIVPDVGQIMRRMSRVDNKSGLERQLVLFSPWLAPPSGSLNQYGSVKGACMATDFGSLDLGFLGFPIGRMWLMDGAGHRRLVQVVSEGASFTGTIKARLGASPAPIESAQSHPYLRAGIALLQMKNRDRDWLKPGVRGNNKLMLLMAIKYGDNPKSASAFLSFEDAHSFLSQGGGSLPVKEEIEKVVKEYLDSGGRIAIVFVNPPAPFNPQNHIATLQSSVNSLKTAEELFSNSPRVSVIDGRNLKDSILDELRKPWKPGSPGLMMEAMNSGYFFDRRINCSPGPSDRRFECQDGPGGERVNPHYAHRAPERYIPLVEIGSASLFDTSTLKVDSDLIGTEKPFGEGRVQILGYSPFARDLWESDLEIGFATPNGDDTCFWGPNGNDADSYGSIDRRTLQHGWGAHRLKDYWHLSRWLRQTDNEQELEWVSERTDQSALDISISFDPKVGLPVVGVDPANLDILLTNVDPVEKLSTWSILPKGEFDGVVQVSINGSPAAELPVLLFPAETKRITEGVEQIAQMTGDVGDGSQIELAAWNAIALVGMFALLVSVSPISRQWNAASEHISSIFSHTEPADIGSGKGGFFAVEAVLNEWGANPGEPGTGRHSGLPAGIRPWTSGDQGSSIIPRTLFPLLEPNAGIPAQRPLVRLKTKNQALDAVLIIDDSGGLLRPENGPSAPKADFTASLAAFIAAASIAANGRCTVFKKSSIEPIYSSKGAADVLTIQKTVSEALSDPQPPTEFSEILSETSISGRLIYFICDGIDSNIDELIGLTDFITAEGGTLRVLIVTSTDDGRLAALVRDRTTGVFIDRTEWTDHELTQLRDQHISELSYILERAAAKVVVFSSDADEQSILSDVRDSGLFS